jgi:hypothetical protein
MATAKLTEEFLNSLYEEIEAEANTDEAEQEQVFFSEAQRGLANRCGMTPDKYMAGYTDWRDIRDLLDSYVEQASRFENAHRDEKGKKQPPASGMPHLSLDSSLGNTYLQEALYYISTINSGEEGTEQNIHRIIKQR